MAALTAAERAVVGVAVALVDGSDPRLHAQRLRAPATPTGLSAPALAAVARVLNHGVARALARGGGVAPWHTRPLAFGSASLDLVHWLHATAVAAPERPDLVLRSTPTAAEAVLLARAAELLDAAAAPLPDALARHAWSWLLAGEGLARTATPGPLDLAPVLADGWLVDVLERRLAQAWTSWARAARAGALAETVRHGEAQERVAQAWLSAAPPERATFLADVLVSLARLPAGVWAVDRGTASLTDWHRARRARSALPRAVAAGLTAWERAWRATAFVDDDFEVAQRRLRRYEEAFAACRSLAAPIAAAEALP